MDKKSLISTKRIYEASLPEDGFRVLVDRLWPRGVSKERADLDLWLKEVAPSKELREWFGHNPLRWQGFVQRYTLELDNNRETVKDLRNIIKDNDRVTLLYAAKDTQHNEALVLRDYLVN